jgi:hypothetical protein
MDWGLAKFRTDARAETAEAATASTFHDPRDDTDEGLKTRTGSFLGTPAYMPPEQAIGAIDQIDERSDVFGLGAVLCEVLTGRPPFVADTREATRQMAAGKKLGDAFARLDGCGEEPELVALCKRCLSPEQADRPRNAGEVAAAVHTFRAEAEERARQAEVARGKAEVQAAEQRKRRRVQAALGGAVVLLLAAGGAFAWWGERRAARNRAVVDASLQRCEAALAAGDAYTAGLALGEVDNRWGEGGTGGFSPRVDRCRAELAALRELDRIDDFMWTEVEVREIDFG